MKGWRNNKIYSQIKSISHESDIMNYSNRYFIINSWLLNSNIIIFGWHILIAKCLTFSILSQCNSNRTKLLQATHNNKVGSWNYQPLLLLHGNFFSVPNAKYSLCELFQWCFFSSLMLIKKSLRDTCIFDFNILERCYDLFTVVCCVRSRVHGLYAVRMIDLIKIGITFWNPGW